jgi:hypothetical protein
MASCAAGCLLAFLVEGGLSGHSKMPEATPRPTGDGAASPEGREAPRDGKVERRRESAADLLIDKFDSLSPAERSELLCRLLVLSDERAIALIKERMPLDAFDKDYLISNAGGIMRPEFAARLVAVVGLPSALPKLLNLDLSRLPLEKHLTAGELSGLVSGGMPELAPRAAIATAMATPDKAGEALEQLGKGLAPEELQLIREKLALTWVITNPAALIPAAKASPSFFGVLGGALGKDPCLNSPENLPLRDILDKAAFDQLKAGAGTDKEDRAGIFSYLVQSHPIPNQSFLDSARSIDDPEISGKLMESVIAKWTATDVVATTQWLYQQSDEPEYTQWVQAFLSSCKDPNIVKMWSAALPPAEESQDQQPHQ